MYTLCIYYDLLEAVSTSNSCNSETFAVKWGGRIFQQDPCLSLQVEIV